MWNESARAFQHTPHTGWFYEAATTQRRTWRCIFDSADTMSSIYMHRLFSNFILFLNSSLQGSDSYHLVWLLPCSFHSIDSVAAICSILVDIFGARHLSAYQITRWYLLPDMSSTTERGQGEKESARESVGKNIIVGHFIRTNYTIWFCFDVEIEAIDRYDWINERWTNGREKKNIIQSNKCMHIAKFDGQKRGMEIKTWKKEQQPPHERNTIKQQQLSLSTSKVIEIEYIVVMTQSTTWAETKNPIRQHTGTMLCFFRSAFYVCQIAICA